MSGICTVWRKDHPELISEVLGAVAGGLSQNAAERVERLSAPGYGVAVSARFASQQVFQNQQVMIACDADLQNEKELKSSLGHQEGIGRSALLAALYERFGSGFVAKLRGSFSFVLWDRRERRLL